MNKFLPLINILAFVVLVVANFIAVLMPFFGKSPGDVSDLYPNLLTPADLTFRIWSVVYILIGIFIFVQAKSYFDRKDSLSDEVEAIGSLFAVSCVLNIGWIVIWTSLFIPLAFAFIFVLWVLLMVVNYKLAKVENASWAYTVPFSIYFAWISIATLATLNVTLINLDIAFLGFNEENWTAGWVGLGVLGTLLFQYLNKSIWFTLVIIWSYFGIYIKNKQLFTDGNAVVLACLIAMVVLAASVVITRLTKPKADLAI